MKTATKTAVSPLSGGVIPLGGHPGNTGGKKGRSGRPPDAFRAICRGLTTREETLAAVRAILNDKDHPAFIGALKWATENGYGKAQQSVDLTTGGHPLHYVVEVPAKAPDAAAWSKRYGPNGDKQR